MKLLTKEIIKRLEKYPLYSQQGKALDSKVLVKFFNPTGCGTWLITEAQNKNGQWLFYGYAELGNGYEAGYIDMFSLENFKGKWNLGIERDMYSKLTTVKEMMK